MPVLETTMGNLQEGDRVLGSDGLFHKIKLLPITKKHIYEVVTSVGRVRCSYDHYWVLSINGDLREFSTVEIFNDISRYRGREIGEHGSQIFLKDVVDTHETLGCRCVEVQDSNDSQFVIFTDKHKKILTRNCSARFVCGRLNAIASQMALGNSLATTIDGKHKGAGIVSVDGIMSNIQYYFADTNWIQRWFKDRGLDENGFPLQSSKKDIDLGEEEEVIEAKVVDKVFDFEGIDKKINSSKDQKFKQV